MIKNCSDNETIITVIVPCYNEEAALPHFFSEAKKLAERMSLTKNVRLYFLFINDGSGDNTLQLLKGFTEDNNLHEQNIYGGGIYLSLGISEKKLLFMPECRMLREIMSC